MGQIIAEASLEAPESYIEGVQKEYVERRNCLVNGLNQIPGVFSPMPKGAFYTVAKLPVDNAEKFCRWLLEEFSYEGETVMMAPASGFYSTKGAGLDEVRLAYVLCCDELRKALVLDHFDIGAASPDLELLDRGGSEGIGAAQDNVAARIGGLLGKLSDGRRLARAVDAHEEHERGVAAEDLFPTIGERVRNLLVQHIKHGIGVGKRLARRLVAQVLHDGARCRSADIA